MKLNMKPNVVLELYGDDADVIAITGSTTRHLLWIDEDGINRYSLDGDNPGFPVGDDDAIAEIDR